MIRLFALLFGRVVGGTAMLHGHPLSTPHRSNPNDNQQVPATAKEHERVMNDTPIPEITQKALCNPPPI